jgi:hypothetical protein
VLGVLSALPVVQVGNLCCCLWVISGGVVAAAWLQQRQPTPITPGDGALVGVFAGLIGTVIYLLLSIPINALMAPYMRVLAERLASTGNLPPQFREMLSDPLRMRPAVIVLDFMAHLFLDTFFSTLGGLIGAVLFKKKTPPGVIDVAPVSPQF